VPANKAEFVHVQEAAHALVGMPANVEPLAKGGRNSRVYHVNCGAGEFALKQYPCGTDDLRDRLATEVGALKLMEQHGFAAVPRVVRVDRARGFALLSWIDGAAVAEITDSDIDAAVAFLDRIHALRAAPTAKAQPLAAEACLSGAEIERQIGERLEHLLCRSGERDLLLFLDRSFAPAFERARTTAKVKADAAGLDFAGELQPQWQSLAASDFGFHNVIRRKDGSLAFVDFEYFGWDDPVKLVADVLLHPGEPLPAPQRRRFRQSAEHLYRDDRLFAIRLDAYLPLFGLRWVLILLNEFIPNRWRRRVSAGVTEGWAEAKATQLSHAINFLAALPEKVEG